MTPTQNNWPGWWDCIRVGGIPLSSVAVGSIHEAGTQFEPPPIEFDTMIGWGQPKITGGVLSTVLTVGREKFIYDACQLL